MPNSNITASTSFHNINAQQTSDSTGFPRSNSLLNNLNNVIVNNNDNSSQLMSDNFIKEETIVSTNDMINQDIKKEKIDFSFRNNVKNEPVINYFIKIYLI